MNLHFISGLPRSGSTLLAAILRQNPRFRAGMSSPVAPIFARMQEAISRKNEAAGFIDDAAKERLLRGVFKSYYGPQPAGADLSIFDTSRSWTSKLPILTRLFPDAKMICCVREVPWIMDSIERLLQTNAFDLSGIFGYDAGTTVFTRVRGLAHATGLVGYAINALKEAYFGELATGRMMLVDYEALCRVPDEAIRHIYEFLGEEPFEHDFENVSYEAHDFDIGLGTPGLHTVRQKVEWIERRSILPPELYAEYFNDAFWRQDRMNVRQIPTIIFVPPRPQPEPGSTVTLIEDHARDRRA